MQTLYRKKRFLSLIFHFFFLTRSNDVRRATSDREGVLRRFDVAFEHWRCFGLDAKHQVSLFPSTLQREVGSEAGGACGHERALGVDIRRRIGFGGLLDLARVFPSTRVYLFS